MRAKMINLDNLTTELRNENSYNLDEMTVSQALKKMNQEDQKVALAITEQLTQIENLTDAAIKTLKNNGRLIYMGAGTSGRLGVLDAVECVPTFGVNSDMVIGLIAGGNKAMVSAIEGIEDDIDQGKSDLMHLNLTAKDMVIGITASGRTPYVIGGINYAQSIGAHTGSLSCNKNSDISKFAELPIEIDCGPEILTGSTRLKSGTAQKMVLNMISTVSMIGIGKVYKNLMVDVKPTNKKLIERSKRIIMQATEVDYDTATRYFEEANENVKLAIVMILTNCNKEEATQKLAKANGFIKNTI